MNRKITRKMIVEVFDTIGADKVIKHKDGTYSIKRGYFYRHGMDAHKWSDKVSEVPGVEVFGYEDHWAAWPKDSYFVAKIKISDENLFAEYWFKVIESVR